MSRAILWEILRPIPDSSLAREVRCEFLWCQVIRDEHNIQKTIRRIKSPSKLGEMENIANEPLIWSLTLSDCDAMEVGIDLNGTIPRLE